MNILLVGFRFDASGGLEIVSAGLAKALSGLGHTVRCAAANSSDPWRSEGYSGTGLAPHNRWIRSLHYRWPELTSGSLMRSMIGWSDLVIVCHCHLLPFVQHCSPRDSTRPVVAWLHGREVWGKYGRDYMAALRKASLLVAVSHYTSDSVANIVGEQRRPLVIPNPVDTDIFHPVSNEGMINRYSLFTVGRHDADTVHKGYDVLLDSLAVLRSRSPAIPVSLTIGGAGPRLAILNNRTREMGLEDCVRFTGSVSRSELARLHGSADLFVFPSRIIATRDEVWGEGFGVVNIEAAACGRPVLTSTHGGCPETIQDGRTGILVDPTDPVAIANGISTVLNLSEDERDAMGRRGREFVVEQFSFPAYSRRLEQLLERLAKGMKV